MLTAQAALSLPRGERLRRAAEFEAVFQHGSRHERATFVALWQRVAERRVGFAVSRQVRGAVARNRARRRVREAYRQVRAEMPTNVALVIVARPAAATCSFRDLVGDLRRLAEAMNEPARRRTGRS